MVKDLRSAQQVLNSSQDVHLFYKKHKILNILCCSSYKENFTVKKGQIKVLSFRLSKITQDTRKREVSSCEKAADNQARSPINLHFVKLPGGVFK
uniref:Uncharacterized protein n=1 Tax=Populus trichocarpa TaxID=3694 RepID=A0A2K1Y797_POPTR